MAGNESAEQEDVKNIKSLCEAIGSPYENDENIRNILSKIEKRDRKIWEGTNPYYNSPLFRWADLGSRGVGIPEEGLLPNYLNTLIDFGVDINSITKWGGVVNAHEATTSPQFYSPTFKNQATALHIAAKNADYDRVKLLLKKGADAKFRCKCLFKYATPKYEGTAGDWVKVLLASKPHQSHQMKVNCLKIADILDAATINNKLVIKLIDEDEFNKEEFEKMNEIEGLENKLKKANKIKDDMSRLEDYLDEKTYNELNGQLEVMKMETDYQKAKDIRDEINQLDMEYQALISSTSYKDVDECNEMDTEIKDTATKIEELKGILDQMKGNFQSAKDIQKSLKIVSDKRKRKIESYGYIDHGSFEKLSEEIEIKKRRLESQEVKNRKYAMFDTTDMECIICFTIPTAEVWACVECDNVICHACLTKLTQECPTCRANLDEKPFKRNRMLERMLQKMK